VTEYVLGFLFGPINATNRQVALIKKNRGPEFNIGKLNGIGGHVEQDEQPYNAMIREFEEETSFRTRWWRKYGVLHVPGYNAMVHLFTSIQPTLAELKSMTDEPVGWYSVHDVICERLSVAHNLKWMIPLALDPNEVYVSVQDPSRPKSS
jgi:8-oxo-dGTP diphosphatase